MKVTAQEILQKEFKTSFRGADREELQSFLSVVAGEIEALVRENATLKDEAKRREQRLAELADRERALQQTMLTAQKVTEDLKAGAEKDAERTLAEAELQAEKIVHGANARLVQVVNEITEMKRQRAQFEAHLRQLVEGHLAMLDAMRAERAPAPASDENVKYLPGKAAGAEG